MVCTELTLRPKKLLVTGMVGNVQRGAQVTETGWNLIYKYCPLNLGNTTTGKGPYEKINMQMTLRICLLRLEFVDDEVSKQWRHKMCGKKPSQVTLADLRIAYASKPGPKAVKGNDGKDIIYENGATVDIWNQRLTDFKMNIGLVTETMSDLLPYFSKFAALLNRTATVVDVS